MGKVGFCLAASCAVASCAIAAILVGRMAKRRRKWNRVLSILREFEEGCATPIGKLRQVVDAMAVEMHAGLASEGGSKLKMLLTYVDRLPNGSEKGTYYALHLGGTDFRVLRVQLGGERSPTLEHRITRQPIPPHLMSSTSEDLFNFIASILEQFVEAEGKNMPRDQIRELGFTFSFPVRQTSLSSGVLLNWTKGFKIQGIVGEDVAKLLQQAIDKRGLGIRITALVNDAVGALALGHYHDEDTVAAVIIGTGTNACYVERTDSIIKCQGLLTNSGNMVVNMEWGNFWSTHLPRTSYDADLDAESSNRNEQGFEKMISGMYLGDIVRRVMYRMSQNSGVFGMATEALSVPFSLRTPLVAIMREDDSPDLGEVMRIMKEVFQIEDMPLKERKIVMRLCDVVTRRAARLVAAGIVGILKKIGRDSSGGFVGGRTKGEFLNTTKRTVIVIEGGLYSSYFTFRECLNETLTEILGEDMSQHVELRILEDGSGIGSCLLAAANSSSGGI